MKLDPTVMSALSWALESIVNEALNYDPGTRIELNNLVGQRISIVISDWSTVLNAEIFDDRVALSLRNDEDYDKEQSSTILTGTLEEYIALAQSDAHTLAGSGIDVQGKVGTLEALQTLIKNIDIDWQDALSQKLGPLALPLHALFKTANDFVRTQVSRNKEIAKEFLEHESGLNVHTEEFRIFQDSVSALRSSTDRLEAKLKRLMRHPEFKDVQ